MGLDVVATLKRTATNRVSWQLALYVVTLMHHTLSRQTLSSAHQTAPQHRTSWHPAYSPSSLPHQRCSPPTNSKMFAEPKHINVREAFLRTGFGLDWGDEMQWKKCWRHRTRIARPHLPRLPIISQHSRNVGPFESASSSTLQYVVHNHFYCSSCLQMISPHSTHIKSFVH